MIRSKATSLEFSIVITAYREILLAQIILYFNEYLLLNAISAIRNA
jgi:hypothetical protein